MARDWKAVLDAERGEKAPDGWRWWVDDGWAKGLEVGGYGLPWVFPNSKEARALPVLRVWAPSDLGCGETWMWTVLAWFSPEMDPDPYSSGGWAGVGEGETIYASDAITAAEDAVTGDGLKALTVEYIRTWESAMPVNCEWCLADGEPFAVVARVTKKGVAICADCASECPDGSLFPEDT